MIAEFHRRSKTLEERLKSAADTYRAVQDYMGWDNEKPFEEIREEAKNLSPTQRADLAILYQKQVDALKGISPPKAYLDILDDVHQKTIAAVIAKYAGRDMGKLSHNDTIGFMQYIADVQRAAWKEKFPDVFKDYPRTRVIKSQDNIFSLMEDEKGSYYYNVPQDHRCKKSTLAAIAAHEPQHSVQEFLSGKMSDGIDLPEPLKEAAIVFNFLDQNEIRNFPPSIYRNNDGGNLSDTLNEDSFKAYLAVPHEVAAFHQGDLMERDIAAMFPVVAQSPKSAM